MLHNKRRHSHEKPMYHNKTVAPTLHNERNPTHSSKDPAAAKSLQSCPTLSDPMDCSLPGSSIHGIFLARVLEWDAIAFSVRDILGK